VTVIAINQRNAQHLYWDVFWWGVLAGSSINFIAVYAAHLQATAFQIALLTLGPAVVNLFVSLPAGHWLAGRALDRMVFLTSLGHRAGYVALVVVPWFLSVETQLWVIPLITVVMSVPGTLLAIAFNAMFADAVPPEMRGQVVGRRNALLAVSTTLTSLACGVLLDYLPFPWNYQAVFGVGALGAGLSSYYLSQIRLVGAPPQRVGQPLNDHARPGLMRFTDAVREAVGLRFLTRSGGQALLRLDLLRGSFGWFILAYFLFYLAQHAPIPLFPVLLVQALHLSDGVISVGNALFYITMLIASVILARLGTRFTPRQLLVVGSVSYLVFPLLLTLTHDIYLYWIASLLGGATWGIANGGLVNRLMERVPELDRPAHMALHNLALNLGILGGSVFGPALEGWAGLREALLLCAGLRLAAGLLLWKWG